MSFTFSVLSTCISPIRVQLPLPRFLPPILTFHKVKFSVMLPLHQALGSELLLLTQQLDLITDLPHLPCLWLANKVSRNWRLRKSNFPTRALNGVEWMKNSKAVGGEASAGRGWWLVLQSLSLWCMPLHDTPEEEWEPYHDTLWPSHVFPLACFQKPAEGSSFRNSDQYRPAAGNFYQLNLAAVVCIRRCAGVLPGHLEEFADPLFRYAKQLVAHLELQNWTVCASFQEDENTSVGSLKCLLTPRNYWASF